MTDSWWRRLLAAVNRSYERRIRAASLLQTHAADTHSPPQQPEEDGAEAAIVNLPRGARRRPVDPPS